MKLKVTFFFALIFLTYIACYEFFPEWTFTKGYLHTSMRIIFQFSFFGLLMCIPILLRANKAILFLLGTIFTVLFLIMALGEIFPIDTTTEPIDIMTLRLNPDGQKVIVREYLNVKTNTTIHDTVTVKDYFIFRRMINKQE